MEEHNRIINQVAKEVLAAHGFFRKGQSRTWLYDCGYYFVQIEFQPSSFSGQGTYCNAGIGFLFEYTDDLNKTVAFNYGWKRIGDYIEYESGERFRAKITGMATSALKYVGELIKFESLEYADAKLTFTSLVYHSLSPLVPLTLNEQVGLVVSILYIALHFW